jgi:hypothetical protein
MREKKINNVNICYLFFSFRRIFINTMSDRKERFLRTVEKYQREENGRVGEYLEEGCGFPTVTLTTEESRDHESLGRLFSVYREYVYDSFLGQVRTHKTIEDRPTLYNILENGPSNYVSMDPAQEADDVRNTYLPTKEDVRRAHMLGGAVEMSSDGKGLLSSVMMLKEATQIQKTSALANSDRHRHTIKRRDLVLGHEMDGFDTVWIE